MGGSRALLHGARMAARPRLRPVPTTPAATSTTQWPSGSRSTAEALHQQLRINHLDWHAFKGQPQRRAAEQLAAALVVLLDEANPPGAAQASAQRQQAEELVAHALGWLRGERRDPGCPSHGH